MRSSNLLFIVGLGAVPGAFSGGVVVHRYVPRSPIVVGLTIGERTVPRPGSAAEWLEARREAARGRVVRFRHGDMSFESTLGALGVEIDTAATLALARRVGHEGPLFRRIRESERARRGAVDVPVVWSINETKARAVIASFAPDVASQPVDARIDLAKHAKIPDVPGKALDVEASLAELVSGTHEDEETITLIVRSTSARVTLADLARVDVEKVVSSFETTFSLHGTGAGRAINIRNAASRIDGIVLAPGEIFSFNDRVGPRTRERGFALAPEIQADEMQLGYGGGTCQASTTLYAAALFGALEIVDRQSHSRPSSYTQMGLDATVSFPLADLKIKNSLSFPIMIHAFSPKPTSIRVEILGGEPVAKVDYAYGVGATEDFVRRVTVKPGLSPGQRVLHQKGIRGFDVTSIVKITYKDGRVAERRYFSGYRPAPEIYWIAPGYDTRELPPLPDHAKGVEGAGDAAALADGFVGG